MCKSFGTFKAVENLSFEVPAGQIFGFLGPNGSGKSTTIRMLCGLITPTSGSAQVVGIDVGKDPEGVRLHIGYMSQKFSLYEDLEVVENLRFFGGIYGLHGSRRRNRIQTVLKLTDLVGMETMLVSSLSVGLRQRLALGAALLHEPSILFLDEPTSGVDPISRRHFWELIYDLAANGTTILVTTHYMDEAEHCNQIVLIRDGKLVGQGSPDHLKKTLVPGPILALECDRPFDAVEIAEKLPGVFESALYGTSVHIGVTDFETTRAALVAALAAKSITTTQLVTIEPTLEDVFIATSGGPSE